MRRRAAAALALGACLGLLSSCGPAALPAGGGGNPPLQDAGAPGAGQAGVPAAASSDSAMAGAQVSGFLEGAMPRPAFCAVQHTADGAAAGTVSMCLAPGGEAMHMSTPGGKYGEMFLSGGRMYLLDSQTGEAVYAEVGGFLGFPSFSDVIPVPPGPVTGTGREKFGGGDYDAVYAGDGGTAMKYLLEDGVLRYAVCADGTFTEILPAEGCPMPEWAGGAMEADAASIAAGLLGSPGGSIGDRP